LRITALDLGAVTGCCFGLTNGTPQFESWGLKAKTPGDRYVNLDAELSSHLRAFKPDVVYAEDVQSLQGMINKGTMRKVLQAMYGYDALLRYVCARQDVRLAFAATQQARRSFLGMQPPKGEGKDRVFARCQMLGWNVANQSESDAGCVWSWAVGCEQPASRIRMMQDAPVRVR
jgi:hypothetical protein